MSQIIEGCDIPGCEWDHSPSPEWPWVKCRVPECHYRVVGSGLCHGHYVKACQAKSRHPAKGSGV